MTDDLPDALAEALGAVISDLRKEWRKELEVITAESRATIAEAKAANTDLIALLREGVAAQVARVDTALGAVRNGKDADPADIAAAVDAAVARAVAALPAPKDGADADMEAIQARIDEAVKAAVAAIPPAKDGEPGRDVDIAEVRAAVAEAIAALPPAVDGKDADPEEIRRIVEAVVAGLPAGKDGKSVTIEELGPAVSEAVTRALADLDERINARAVELISLIPRPKDGESVDLEQVKATIIDVAKDIIASQFRQPQDGKDVDMAAVAEMVKGAVGEAVALIPPAKDGESVTGEDIAPLIVAEVEKAVAALPPAKNGESVDPAHVEEMIAKAVAALPPATPGKDVDMEEVARAIDDQVAKAVSALPLPKDGSSVTLDDVRPLVAESVAAAVKEIPEPKDGVGLAGALIDRGGNLVVTLTNGEARELGPVVGRDADSAAISAQIREIVEALPQAKDGVDGVGFDDMSIDYDGEKTVKLVFTKGDTVKEAVLVLPIIIDRGYYAAGKSYVAGDAVSWAGNLYIAKQDTSAKPDDETAWRLAVKRGRDGRDLVPKEPQPKKQVKAG